MGAKLSSPSKNDLSENYLTYLTEHTGLQREQVLLNIPKRDHKTLPNFEGPRLLHKIQKDWRPPEGSNWPNRVLRNNAGIGFNNDGGGEISCQIEQEKH